MKKRLICFVLSVMIAATQIVSVGATTEDQIKQQKAATQSQLNSTTNTLSTLQDQRDQLNKEISSLDANLVNTLCDIELMKTDISNTETQIEQSKLDLADAEEDRDTQYEAMKKRIQYIYEEGGDSAWVNMLLKADSVESFLNKVEYAQELHDYDRTSLENYVAVVNQVTELKSSLESQKSELESMEADLEVQQADLEEQLSSKRASSSNVDSQISTAQAQAAELEELIQAQNAELVRLEEERKAQEAAAAAAAAQQAAAQQAAAAQQSSSNKSTASNNTADTVMTGEDSHTSTPSKSSGSASKPSSESSSTDNTSSSGSSSSDEEESNQGGSSSGSATGNAVVDYACRFVGNPYVWGGTSLTGGADCSGFTQSVFAHFGYSLPRTSSEQRSAGRGVSYSQAQPGDLICYSGHVAIYMGGGQIVHASNARDGIKISSNAAYRTIVAVRRIVG